MGPDRGGRRALRASSRTRKRKDASLRRAAERKGRGCAKGGNRWPVIARAPSSRRLDSFTEASQRLQNAPESCFNVVARVVRNEGIAQKPQCRARESGHPDLAAHAEALDSRLRGNDTFCMTRLGSTGSRGADVLVEYVGCGKDSGWASRDRDRQPGGRSKLLSIREEECSSCFRS